ncbi:MAG: HNH endonuclease family protein, partial [Verrucomicrobiota bacterium]
SSKEVRYLLARIERHLSPDTPLDEAELIVEHVLPQNADDLWRRYFTDQADEFAERLGNMTLVTASENRRLARKPFDQKTVVFGESPFKISQKIANYPEWQADQIESRQKWLAEQACAIWRVPQFDS